MGLTSATFEIIMICLAVAALAAVVWAWPRAGGSRPADLAARAGLLAGSQAVVIAAFAVCLNGYFGFFGSWSDLIGDGTPAASTSPASTPGGARHALTVSTAQPGPAPGKPLLAATPLPGSKQATNRQAAEHPAVTGRLLQVSMTGPRTGITVAGAYVYLPPQYFQPAYARDRFPVVLALTGYPGSSWSMVTRLGLPAEAARLVAHRRLPPAIYVMMNSAPAMPRDTECTNVPAGPQVQTFFAQDVPSIIERHFRAQSGPSGWAVLGYSTGGYCAAKLAMLDPYQFGAAVSLAGYYVALRDGTTGDLYGGSLGYRHENDLAWRLRHLPAPPVSLLVTSSRAGETSYPGTLAFLRLVRPPMRAYSLFLPQGGHNFRTWSRELPQCLDWLGRRLAPPRSPA